MNITNLAIFLFAVLLSVGAMDSFSMFGGSPQGYNYTDINSTASGMTGTGQYQVNSTSTAAQASIWGYFWYIVNGFTMLLGALAITLNIGGYLMGLFPFLPAIFAYTLTAVVDVIFGLGIIQYFSGRSEKLMK